MSLFSERGKVHAEGARQSSSQLPGRQKRRSSFPDGIMKVLRSLGHVQYAVFEVDREGKTIG